MYQWQSHTVWLLSDSINRIEVTRIIPTDQVARHAKSCGNCKAEKTSIQWIAYRQTSQCYDTCDSATPASTLQTRQFPDIFTLPICTILGLACHQNPWSRRRTTRAAQTAQVAIEGFLVDRTQSPLKDECEAMKLQWNSSNAHDPLQRVTLS